MKKQGIIIIMSLLLVACGGSDTPANDNVDASTLGTVFDTYTEQSEANNDTSSTSELTSYTLNTNGLKITGTFESSNNTWDYYRFNSGSFSTVDVYVLINGVIQDANNARIFLSLDNYVEDGYSSYSGNYFDNASVSITGGNNQDWVVGITESPGGNVAGVSYTIEIHYNP
jgi:hypothetical protein